jgi:hypothetical protein
VVHLSVAEVHREVVGSHDVRELVDQHARARRVVRVNDPRVLVEHVPELPVDEDRGAAGPDVRRSAAESTCAVDRDRALRELARRAPSRVSDSSEKRRTYCTTFWVSIDTGLLSSVRLASSAAAWISVSCWRVQFTTPKRAGSVYSRTGSRGRRSRTMRRRARDGSERRELAQERHGGSPPDARASARRDCDEFPAVWFEGCAGA